jgi:hypothetical protein
MELIDFVQIPSESISGFEPDLFIVASGYESRSLVIPQKLNNPGQRKVVLAFTERQKYLHRPKNDQYFRDNNYEIIYTSGFETPDYEGIFNDYNQAGLKILIDISVMTRKWYYALLTFLHLTNRFKRLQIRVCYSPAFSNAPVLLRRKISLHSFEKKADQKARHHHQKKTALLLGLGVEIGLSQNIFDKIDPDYAILFYAEPAVQKEYVENVFVTNHNIINRIPIRNMIGYPVLNPVEIYKLFIDTVLPLRDDYHVVIVPQGPKIFSFMTMLFQNNYPDIELVYPGYHLKHAKDRLAYPEITVLDLHYVNEE